MTAIDKATRDLNNLEDKRKHLIQRAVELADERERISFSVHGENDAKARKRLDVIHSEVSTLASEQLSVESALTVARRNLEQAQREAASAADIETAKQIAALKTSFVENGANAGDALSDFVGSILEMKQQRDEMESLGLRAPTARQFQVNAIIAIKTALMKLPQPMLNDLQEWRLLTYPQRMDFKNITSSWSEMIDRQIADRLPKKDAA
jgi:hypothetical protein